MPGKQVRMLPNRVLGQLFVAPSDERLGRNGQSWIEYDSDRRKPPG
jgi:hypothetical protein